MSIVDYQIEMMRKFYGGTDNTHCYEPELTPEEALEMLVSTYDFARTHIPPYHRDYIDHKVQRAIDSLYWALIDSKEKAK